jgi:uncharacterized damage-inducible protein DinB
LTVVERTDPEQVADELTMLSQYLDYHRATLLAKAGGLDDAGWRAKVGASELTLAGLVKHMALVEDSWFQETMGGEPAREPWASAPWDDDRDWEFHTAPDDDPAEVLDLYREACARSRATVARLGDPEALAASRTRRGNRPSLRWVMLHMLEETARHNGHADLIRERVDGTTGE